jgi:hypothetical protein
MPVKRELIAITKTARKEKATIARESGSSGLEKFETGELKLGRESSRHRRTYTFEDQNAAQKNLSSENSEDEKSRTEAISPASSLACKVSLHRQAVESPILLVVEMLPRKGLITIKTRLSSSSTSRVALRTELYIASTTYYMIPFGEESRDCDQLPDFPRLATFF